MSCLTDFICYMGADWERQLTIMEADGVTQADLAGASAEFQVRDQAGGTLLLTASASIEVTSSVILLEISNSETSNADTTGLRMRTVTEYVDDNGTRIEADGYAAVYAVELTYSDGKIETILTGRFCLVPEIVE